jgi:hypothetical protein
VPFFSTNSANSQKGTLLVRFSSQRWCAKSMLVFSSSEPERGSMPQGLAVEMDAVLLADARMLHAEPNGMPGRVAKYSLRMSRLGA